MKLSPQRTEQTLRQFEAQAVPEDHAVVPELNKVFGDHTYFLNGDGLHIVEPSVERTDGGGQTGRVIKLASWGDAGRTTLAPHVPEVTDVEVMLDAA
jgi:hypothetical protein